MAGIKRKHKRISKRYPIYFGEAFPKDMGFIKNLSLGGVAISSKTVYAQKTKLVLRINDDENFIDLQGIVRWCTDLNRIIRTGTLMRSMGIEFIDPPSEYTAFLFNLFEGHHENRTSPRFERAFNVILDPSKESIERFAVDISMGGMFIATSDLPQVNTFVEIKILLPDAMKAIRTKARVVHVVDAEKAVALGLNQGFGVQFAEFFDQGREYLDHYVRNLDVPMEED